MADLGAIGKLFSPIFNNNIMVASQGNGALVGTISGTVLDNSGNPASRVLRAYRRNDGRFVSETISDGTTGAYSLPAVDGVEHNVIAFDDAGGITENDLILRTTP